MKISATGIVKAGLIVIGAFGLVVSVRAEQNMSSGMFSLYQSSQPNLPVSFEYPSEWRTEFSKGATENYSQVQIYAPDALDKRLRTYIVVRIMPPKDQGGRYASIAEAVEEYRKTLMSSWRIVEEQRIEVSGVSAYKMDINGTLRLPWRSPKAQDVPIRSQRIFFEKDGRLYELSWLATSETAPQLEDAFSHLIQTLEIVNNS